MKRILFQGDSITDADRNREVDNFLGSGCANMVAGWLTSEYPMEYECINRGIGGDRIIDIGCLCPSRLRSRSGRPGSVQD